MNYSDEEMQDWTDKARRTIVEEMAKFIEDAEKSGDKMNIAKVSAACTSALLSSLLHIMAALMPPDVLPMAAMGIGGQFVAMASQLKDELKKAEKENEKI